MKKFATSTLLGAFILVGFQAAQAQVGQEAADTVIRKVLDVLTERKTAAAPADSNLQNTAWEALAYLEDTGGAGSEMLREAVPDYYHFRADDLVLKLIDPDDPQQYGLTASAGWRLTADGILVIFDPNTDKQLERWRVIYLDSRYLALDMEGLRVFFTRTARQE